MDAGVEVANGVGQSITKVHLVFVRGAKTINFAWSGNAFVFKNEPVPYPVPVTGGNPLSNRSWLYDGEPLKPESKI